MGKKVDRFSLEIQGGNADRLLAKNSLGDLREAVVHVLPGESKEDAWARHLFDNPQDKNVFIKIFIVPSHRSSHGK